MEGQFFYQKGVNQYMTTKEKHETADAYEQGIQLLEDFFALRGNVHSEKLPSVKAALIKYLGHPETIYTKVGKQVSHALNLLQIYKQVSTDFMYNFFYSCNLALPIFDQLDNETSWDIYDIRLLASSLNHHQDYKKVCSMFHLMIEKLEAYHDHPLYEKIPPVALVNLLRCLLNAKYLEEDVWKRDPELVGMFISYSAQAMFLLGKTGMKEYIPVVKLRQALVHGNLKLAESFLNDIKAQLSKNARDIMNGEMAKHDDSQALHLGLAKNTVFDDDKPYATLKRFDLSQSQFQDYLSDFAAKRVTQLRLNSGMSAKQLSLSIDWQRSQLHWHHRKWKIQAILDQLC